jgi:endonuclease I
MTPSEFAAAYIKPPALLPYSAAAPEPDVWDAVCEADAARGGDAGAAAGGGGGGGARVRLIYSGYVISAGPRDSEYSVGRWTREHVWPKSHGGMSTRAPGIGTDAHNIFAADQSVNSARSDRDFDDLPGGDPVVDSSDTHGYGGETLARTSGGFWEPPDRAKGPVSRALLYMACAYADRGLRLARGATPRGGKSLGDLEAVLRWNDAFPPGPDEVERNNAVQRHQGNRNPFIDMPELARLVDWDRSVRE